MGAVFVKKAIYDAFMNGPDHLIEFFHGYTYSGNPVASAAASPPSTPTRRMACSTAAPSSPSIGRTSFMRSRACPTSLTSATAGWSGRRAGVDPGFAHQARLHRLHRGLRERPADPHHRDIIALSPPLIISKAEIDQLFETLAGILKGLA